MINIAASWMVASWIDGYSLDDSFFVIFADFEQVKNLIIILLTLNSSNYFAVFEQVKKMNSMAASDL